MSRSTVILFLLVIGIVGFLLRLHEAQRLSDLAHPDEVFQTLEPAHRLAYGYGVITWEWRDGIRSWVFPTLLAGIMKRTAWMGRGSIGYLLAIRILLSLFSMTTVWFGFVWAKRVGGTVVAIISAIACATWYELIGFAPRALTEVVAAHALLIGLYLGVCSESSSEERKLFLAGAFCGVAMSVRVQLTPVVVFAALYFCRGCWRRRLPIVVAGILLPTLIFGLVDAFTWGHAFQSFYLYFWENAVQGKSLTYGTKPWYWYLGEEVGHLGPLSLLALLGVRRSAFLGWVVIIIIASHSVLAHKEARFLYPALPIIIVLSALGCYEMVRQCAFVLKQPFEVLLVMAVSCILLFSALSASRFPYWLKPSEAMEMFGQLSKNPGVCGVGLYGVPWFITGGYAYLHQNVPILVVDSEDQFDKEKSSFNIVVAQEGLPISGSNFVLSRCSDATCLYRRTGPCTQSSDNEINTLLRATGN